MADTLESIRKRYSCRAFTGQALSQKETELLRDAALAAPSAVNFQPWRILVLQDKGLLGEMDAYILEQLRKADNPAAFERISSRGGKVFYNAPAIFYIFRDESPHSPLDCGIVAQNITLAAQGLGLGSVICGMAGIAMPVYEERLRGLLPDKSFLPEQFVFATSVLVGKAIAEGTPHPLDQSKALILP